MASRPQPSHHPSPTAEGFACESFREGGGTRLRVSGALDLATVPILEAELAALHEAGVRRLILDLSELAFMDSTGLRCILQQDAEARRDGFEFSLVAGPHAVQRVFDVTGTTARLPFIDG
jgi:anti-anti-sigma factor